MLSAAFLLLMNSAFLTLRLASPAGSFPRPLSHAEEDRYLSLWQEGDLDARNVLIEHNLRLVAHIIKKYYASENDQDDLISIGTIGLIKGISTYRADKGVRLATYASRCIENEILMYFRSQKKTSGELSLSESIDTDGDGNSLSLMDVIADETDMTEALCSAELCSRLGQYMDECLDTREAEILRLRYGLGDQMPLTQRETAQLLNISRSYISRIEKKALDKLKRIIEKD